MVSSEYPGKQRPIYPGKQRPISVAQVANLPGRADGIGDALRSAACMELALPADMEKLLRHLDSIKRPS